MASKNTLKFLDALSANVHKKLPVADSVSSGTNSAPAHAILEAPDVETTKVTSSHQREKRTSSESEEWEQAHSKKSKKRRKCPKLVFTDGTQAGHALDTKSVSHCILSQLVGGGGNAAARGQDSIAVAGRRVDCVVVFAVDGLDQESYRKHGAFMPFLRNCFEKPRAIQLPKLYNTDRDQCKMSSSIARACMYPNTPNAHYKKLRKSIAPSIPVTPAAMSKDATKSATVMANSIHGEDQKTTSVDTTSTGERKLNAPIADGGVRDCNFSEQNASAVDSVGDTIPSSETNASSQDCTCRFVGDHRWTLETLRLNASERRANFYPLPSDVEANGYIKMPDHATETAATGCSCGKADDNNVVGIDCEMVLTTNGKELARCTVVNQHYDIIMDKLVKPAGEVVNYLTQYSGMTEQKLEAVRTTLGDIQAELQRLLTRQTVIIGHGLENDLHVLKIYHENVVDTSLCIASIPGFRRKKKLKDLALQHLGLAIQQSHEGHDSAEDARVAMQLVEKRIQTPGLYLHENDIPKQESLAERLTRNADNNLKTMVLMDPLDYGHIVAHTQWDNVAAHSCRNNEAVFQTIRSLESSANTPDFIWTRLADMGQIQEATMAAKAASADCCIKKLTSVLQEKGKDVLAFVLGYEESAELESLTHDRFFSSLHGRSAWTPDDDARMSLLRTTGRSGLLFAAINPANSTEDHASAS
eukprot:m.553474 g.553474  ORF g.553474 m.553474 type:complete len:700 (+) comp22169_c0_seq2:112-2211(+)